MSEARVTLDYHVIRQETAGAVQILFKETYYCLWFPKYILISSTRLEGGMRDGTVSIPRWFYEQKVADPYGEKA